MDAPDEAFREWWHMHCRMSMTATEAFQSLEQVLDAAGFIIRPQVRRVERQPFVIEDC